MANPAGRTDHSRRKFRNHHVIAWETLPDR